VSTTSLLAPVIACHQEISVTAKADEVVKSVTAAAAAKPKNFIFFSLCSLAKQGSDTPAGAQSSP
jgi:hypothetical protein